jgi:hypothetical protein
MLSAAIIVIVGLFGLLSWASIAMTARTGFAQGRRARLIGVQMATFTVVTAALWATQPGAPDVMLFLYLHAATVSATDLALLRWRRWRLWAGV